MKLTFLGSGTAFSPMQYNFNSNMVLQSPSGKNLMIDCGIDARHSTLALGYSTLDFDAVFISHFHGDHCGGLEWFAICRKFSKNSVKPNLIIHPTMLDELWDNILCGGLSTLENENCTLQTFFEVYSLEDDCHFVWEGIQFELVRTRHVFHMQELRPSFGLFIDDGKTRLFITADTQFTPDLFDPYFNAADYIFHDCETTPNKTGVHAHYDSLVTLPEQIKKKMWLYHYSTLYKPNSHDSFLGFVERGQVFDF